VQRTNGGWFISFSVERSVKQRRARRPRAVVGVDVGLARLATLSTGHVVENSRPLQSELRRLRRLQRRLDRQRRANNPANYHPDGRAKNGCSTWVKSGRMVRTERRVGRLHERVANLRREQAHQLTTALVREFGVIGVETLAVKNLLANRRLALHITDVGWGIVLAQLKYKTSWSDGSLLVAADRFYPSSKTCSACGAVKAKLRLADRVFTCDRPRLRARSGPRLKRGPEPRPHRGPARAGGGHRLVRGPHRTVHANCARRAGQPRPPGRAQPREARSVPGRTPTPRGAGSRS
jgi:putative transposase